MVIKHDIVVLVVTAAAASYFLQLLSALSTALTNLLPISVPFPISAFLAAQFVLDGARLSSLGILIQRTGTDL